LTHPFGSFHAEIEVEAGGVMIYTRRLEMTRRRISIEEYTAYRAFAEAVARSDDGMVVLVKRGS
jgi:hypothetical protein